MDGFHVWCSHNVDWSQGLMVTDMSAKRALEEDMPPILARVSCMYPTMMRSIDARHGKPDHTMLHYTCMWYYALLRV
jgi:hypothetical protein